MPGVAQLRAADGKVIVALEKTDVTRLVAAGWQPPAPITVKARDGVTDLHGLMYKPTNLDPAKKYPIVNHVYPGPQTGSVGSRTFNAARGDAQALAELGFIVVEIDGMGTPWRSKKFHEAYYGNMGDNTLPDQVAGMKELASRYPWIDIDRAGIYGHSGGGYAAADACSATRFFKSGSPKRVTTTTGSTRTMAESGRAARTNPTDDQLRTRQPVDAKTSKALLLRTDWMTCPRTTRSGGRRADQANKDFEC